MTHRQTAAQESLLRIAKAVPQLVCLGGPILPLYPLYSLFSYSVVWLNSSKGSDHVVAKAPGWSVGWTNSDLKAAKSKF